MPPRGRKRLTQEDLDARIADYCRRHGVHPTAAGLPPFPAGRRETEEHREWLGIYKLKHRLGRRGRGQCERCSAPASAGSVFCDAHRTGGVSARAGKHAATLEERQALLESQRWRCPLCQRPVGLRDSIEHRHADGRMRGLLHQGCNQLAGLAEAEGPDVLERLRAYLWPGTRARRA
jgi:recombination endonuclease VII